MESFRTFRIFCIILKTDDLEGLILWFIKFLLSVITGILFFHLKLITIGFVVFYSLLVFLVCVFHCPICFFHTGHQSTGQSAAVSQPSEFDIMINQVKIVLPHVPVDAIRGDLGMYGSPDIRCPPLKNYQHF